MDGVLAGMALRTVGPWEGRTSPPGTQGRSGLKTARGLKSAIGCGGIGLHGGTTVHLRFVPAPPGEGISFCRVDLPGAPTVPARWNFVADTRMCTLLADPARPDMRVGTVEHVMAALAGLGIDDARIEIDGPECPILDGSAAEFAFLITCAGIVETDTTTETIEIMRPVRVVDGAACAALYPAPRHPAPDTGLSLALEIEFTAGAIGRQTFALDLTPATFMNELARARTFTFADQVETLQEAGLARGGSLANAIVVDGNTIRNPEGLRYTDEFVRHKLLDVVGDLALAGAPLVGHFEGTRTGHRINNMLLHTLFADTANYRISRVAGTLAAVA